jgi:hypothetical protein
MVHRHCHRHPLNGFRFLRSQKHFHKCVQLRRRGVCDFVTFGATFQKDKMQLRLCKTSSDAACCLAGTFLCRALIKRADKSCSQQSADNNKQGNPKNAIAEGLPKLHEGGMWIGGKINLVHLTLTIARCDCSLPFCPHPRCKLHIPLMSRWHCFGLVSICCWEVHGCSPVTFTFEPKALRTNITLTRLEFDVKLPPGSTGCAT